MLPRTFGHEVKVPKNLKSHFNLPSYLQGCLMSPKSTKRTQKYKNILLLFTVKDKHFIHLLYFSYHKGRNPTDKTFVLSSIMSLLVLKNLNLKNN